jgi:hypothetical protein
MGFDSALDFWSAARAAGEPTRPSAIAAHARISGLSLPNSFLPLSMRSSSATL